MKCIVSFNTPDSGKQETTNKNNSQIISKYQLLNSNISHLVGDFVFLNLELICQKLIIDYPD